MYKELDSRTCDGLTVDMYTDGRTIDVVVSVARNFDGLSMLSEVAAARGVTRGRDALEIFEHPLALIPGAAERLEVLESHARDQQAARAALDDYPDPPVSRSWPS